jgi:hypothetical protein
MPHLVGREVAPAQDRDARGAEVGRIHYPEEDLVGFAGGRAVHLDGRHH